MGLGGGFALGGGSFGHCVDNRCLRRGLYAQCFFYWGFFHCAQINTGRSKLSRHAVQRGAAGQIAIQANRPRCVIIAWNDVINSIW